MKIEILYTKKSKHIKPVAEAMAIQSLPQDFVLPDNIPLTYMFKMIGNGVPYLMAKYIARTLKDVLSEIYDM